MPKYIKNNQCFILNTDSSKQKGTHWVGFYKTNGKLYYYDSFARNAQKLTKRWKSSTMCHANTKDRDQSMTEKNCGSRAFSWLVIMRKYGIKCLDVV